MYITAKSVTRTHDPDQQHTSHYQHEYPVGEDAGHDTAYGVAEDGFACELAGSEAVHHGDVGAQVSAPAHAHGGEDRDVSAGGLAVCQHAGDQGDGRSCGAQGRDGNGNAFVGSEAEEGLQYEAELFGDEGEEADSFVGGAGVGAVR